MYCHNEGDWLGGYMEDGSYTGYGQLDKDGNYVGPNPNDTSDEEDYTEESNWDDQEEDDYEE